MGGWGGAGGCHAPRRAADGGGGGPPLRRGPALPRPVMRPCPLAPRPVRVPPVGPARCLPWPEYDVHVTAVHARKLPHPAVSARQRALLFLIESAARRRARVPDLAASSPSSGGPALHSPDRSAVGGRCRRSSVGRRVSARRWAQPPPMPIEIPTNRLLSRPTESRGGRREAADRLAGSPRTSPSAPAQGRRP